MENQGYDSGKGVLSNVKHDSNNGEVIALQEIPLNDPLPASENGMENGQVLKNGNYLCGCPESGCNIEPKQPKVKYESWTRSKGFMLIGSAACFILWAAIFLTLVAFGII